MSIFDWSGTPTLSSADEFVMPIVVDLSHPDAAHEDALAAVARAVALLMHDERSAPGGQWHEDVAEWSAGRIRKVVRRARGAAWERAVSENPGVAAVHGTTAAWASPPVRLNQALPKSLSKLQVAFDLPRRGVTSAYEPESLAIAENPEVVMSTGKTCAQVAHIAHIAALNAANEEWKGRWADCGLDVQIVAWQSDQPADLFIQDAGFTEIEPGTLTAVGWYR